MSERTFCGHGDFDVSATVVKVQDTQQYYLEVRVRCHECGEPFRFMGVPNYGLFVDRPSLNPDSTELTCPIAAGPAEFLPAKMPPRRPA